MKTFSIFLICIFLGLLTSNAQDTNSHLLGNIQKEQRSPARSRLYVPPLKFSSKIEWGRLLELLDYPLEYFSDFVPSPRRMTDNLCVNIVLTDSSVVTMTQAISRTGTGFTNFSKMDGKLLWYNSVNRKYGGFRGFVPRNGGIDHNGNLEFVGSCYSGYLFLGGPTPLSLTPAKCVLEASSGKLISFHGDRGQVDSFPLSFFGQNVDGFILQPGRKYLYPITTITGNNWISSWIFEKDYSFGKFKVDSTILPVSLQGIRTDSFRLFSGVNPVAFYNNNLYAIGTFGYSPGGRLPTFLDTLAYGFIKLDTAGRTELVKVIPDLLPKGIAWWPSMAGNFGVFLADGIKRYALLDFDGNLIFNKYYKEDSIQSINSFTDYNRDKIYLQIIVKNSMSYFYEVNTFDGSLKKIFELEAPPKSKVYSLYFNPKMDKDGSVYIANVYQYDTIINGIKEYSFNYNFLTKIKASNFWKTSSEDLSDNTNYEIQVGRNPSQDFWRIGVPENGSLELFDISGRSIRKIDEVFKTSPLSISCEDLPTGTYFLKWKGENGIALSKLIKL
jgi:hypothetical protein